MTQIPLCSEDVSPISYKLVSYTSFLAQFGQLTPYTLSLDVTLEVTLSFGTILERVPSGQSFEQKKSSIMAEILCRSRDYIRSSSIYTVGRLFSW